ncbi:Protein phosphatase methylesterase 1 [Coemansia thaxteri]|uniref:Protein phosphatase methylesterase 1 n=1 Tax=Coemansia thaxteri TaxID=2663907 RepID=A0A9W8EMD3_9FUNG|nr:Protein phosphatase methylesterase 1 [Coemansia thaxteri]
MDFRQHIFKARTIPLPLLEQTPSDATQFQPLDWADYFENQQSVTFGDTAFNVYCSGLSYTGPIFVFHHGAGHSGLSFALAAKHIFSSIPRGPTVVALDARGHGCTAGENQGDLSLERMVDDFVGVIQELFPNNSRAVVLVGHSMGGAVVAHAAESRRISRVTGLVLIDIVEGTAMDSLSSIPMFIGARPSTFSSVESAIKWHLDSGAIQNTDSARLSVPSLVVPTQGDGAVAWTWRTRLLPTERFWPGWYTGLSKTFVAAPTAKLLILAGTDRLDKELLIAQMQGKFQLELLPAAGHTIQEDLPDRVGDTIVAFWRRNQPLNIPVRRPDIPSSVSQQQQ